jgi:hypothetical protein
MLTFSNFLLVWQKSIAVDVSSGRTIASGDEDGIIRLIRLEQVDKVF